MVAAGRRLCPLPVASSLCVYACDPGVREKSWTMGGVDRGAGSQISQQRIQRGADDSQQPTVTLARPAVADDE